MSVDGLFELAARREQDDDLAERTATGRREALLRWCDDYGAGPSWVPGTVDVLTACGPGSRWCGAPTAVPGSAVETTSVVMRPLTPRALLMLSAASLGRAGHDTDTPWTTDDASRAGSTWLGRELLVAGLLDEEAAGLASFSAMHWPLVSRVGRLRAGVGRRRAAGLSPERTGERLLDAPEVENFAIYSAVPLGRGTRRALQRALAGWTGHLRAQSPSGSGSGLFMAWHWHGEDPARWSAQADRTLAVLESVRDALVHHAHAEPAPIETLTTED